MSGMMTAGEPKLDDPILQQIENGIEAKLKPEIKTMYMSITTAAMSIMFGQQTHALMQKRLASNPDITVAVSSAVADLIAALYNKIAPRLKPEDKDSYFAAAGPAAVTLMCQMLNYAEKTGGAQVTPDIAAKCSQMTTSAVLQKFGVGPDKVQKAVQMSQAQQAGGAPQPGGAALPPPQGA